MTLKCISFHLPPHCSGTSWITYGERMQWFSKKW